MASDEPIEPIHRIEMMEVKPARGLRNRGYHVFTRYLENLLRWKRFDLANQRVSSKKITKPMDSNSDSISQDNSDEFNKLA